MASNTKTRMVSFDAEKYILLYDRRKTKGDSPEIELSLESSSNFEKFKTSIQEVLGLSTTDKYIITTVNRDEVNDDKTFETHVHENTTIYVLDDVQQELQAPTKVRVEYQPHYDTLIKSGMYEYYASEGKQPLPFAIAELIDNSLGATANNIGSREIELRLLFDESQGKNAICVIDNGRGMTTKQLNNWAVYRLSKFLRNEEDDNGLNSLDVPLPRSLNSDISYFGVGGKHAVFYMGNSCRMITKPKKSKDVHELLMSKDAFETKEKNKEDIYKGFISNRKPGYSAHLSAEDENIRKIIAEEVDKESFTCVVVTVIRPEHVLFLKTNFKSWCRQLAHIFHYYIHGPMGNISSDCKEMPSSIFTNINITVKMFVNRVPPKIINLRFIEDDLQTQYIRTASSNFEFKATVEGTGMVEGLLYYHPFLYDRETFPIDPNDLRGTGIPEPEDDHDYATNDVRPARGKRDIFECFWNGRLIPYTTIAEFDWCAVPKRSKVVPIECYNRISGMLWTNDKFQVSTNKLTFSDLEVRLKDKNTVFTRIIGGHEKRANIDKQFTDWLKDCHENFDKQIEFLGFKGMVIRTDLPKNRQSPWSQFERIKWDNKMFEIGQLVRILRTLPITFGTVKRFLLYGEHEGDVFATGGDVEIMQEPRSLYDDIKIVPIAKLDRTATPCSIKKFVDEEEGKFPNQIVITWPDGDQLNPNERRPAGKTIGAIKVEIVNKKGDLINKLPGNSSKKLLVELKIIWHAPSGDETIVSHIGQHSKNWAYWFRKMENIKNLGPHTLQFQVLLSENNSSSFGGSELPCLKLKFTVTEAEPDKFTVGLLDGPFRIGAPFQIPLEFQDGFNHQTKPNAKLKPILDASGLDLSYDGVQIKGNLLLIKGIVARGSVSTNSGKNFNLTVKIPGLGSDSQTLKIRLHPGPPHKLVVKPESEVVSTENGSPIAFDVDILDISGNVTAEPKLNVICKFTGSDGLPVYTLDCSNTGHGVLTGDGLRIKKFKDSHTLKAIISLQNYRDISPVEKIIQILPSTRAASLELVYQMDSGITARIEHEQELQWTAGECIRGLTFKLYDEANREISIEANLISKLKVNWTPKLNKETVMKGLLPDVKVPNGIGETKYCHIGLNDGLEFSFTIKPTAGEPAHLKCSLTGNNQSRLGEVLPSDILVSIADKYGNVIKKLPGSAVKALEISGDGLLLSEIDKALGQSAGFVLRRIKFSPNSPLGPKELCVKWNNLVDYVRVIIVAGPPTQLHLPKWPVEQPLTIFNEGKLEFPIVVQLCDSAGNPSPEANIKVQLCPDSRLKLIPPPQTIKTDSHGKVNFGIFTVNAPSGNYEIYAKAIHGRVTITSSVSQLCIQPDMNKPTKVSVVPSTNISLHVGEELPVFKVKVLAETDQPVLSAQASHIKMKLWKVENQNSKSSSNPFQFNVDNNKQSEPGLFIFSNKKMPEVAGSYNALFTYDDGKYAVSGKMISLQALPGPPIKLEPIQVPSTPTVSNCQKVAMRYLIRNLKLELRDAYDNPTGANLNGKIILNILGNGDEGELPQLEGGKSILEVGLIKGKAMLQNILLEENTGGKDGVDYCLRCTVELNNNKTGKSISPYDIPFLFYNDAKKQREMSELSKERDTLVGAIKAYRSLFATTTQLISELRVAVQSAAQEEQKLKLELRKQVPASQLNSIDSIDHLIKQKLHEKDKLLNSTRRKCTLPPTTHDPEVLGKIGHLAQVLDADVARVLSWHMKGDMDCIVTYTTAKAKELYHGSNGSQQVLALDSVFKKIVPEWNKPLPHTRVKNSNWKPSGNPIYVRQLLIFHNKFSQVQNIISFEEQLDLVLASETCLTKEEFRTLRQFLIDHKENFSDTPGKTKLVTHRINTGSNPPIQKKPYPVSPKKKEIIEKHIEEMLKGGIIRESYSDWSSPVVLVDKPDKTIRFCVDYRALNAITQSDQFPMPRIDEIIQQLNGAKFISALDMTQGYFQMEIEEKDRKKSAFVTHMGLYEFNVMSFGLKCAPASFCRLMSKVLKGLIGKSCFIYLDDIILFSKTFKEHLKHLSQIFDRLKKENLFIKLKKCQFARIESKFLGKIINNGNIKIDPEKIRAIVEYPIPKNIKAVQRFLGMAGWIRNHLENFAKISKPLVNLTHKGKKYIWTEACEESFKLLKAGLISEKTILSLPDFDRKFYIETDASGEALGAILSQLGDDGSLKVIEYASRLLHNAETRYDTTERECLCLVWAFKKFRGYVSGVNFTAITDNKALKWLLNTKDIYGRLTRWALRLQEFDFNVQYREGKKNIIPDALSRASILEEVEDLDIEMERISPPTEFKKIQLISMTPYLTHLNLEEIIKRQNEEHWIKNIKNKILSQIIHKSGTMDHKQYKNYILIDNVLCYNPINSKNNVIKEPRIVIPSCMIDRTLYEFHNTPHSGHLGRDKTYDRLKGKVFWHHMYRGLKDYIRKCCECQLAKPHNKRLRAPMMITYVEKAMQMIGVDLMGPYPRSKLLNRFILVIVDYYSKWIEVIPLRNSNTVIIARHLREFFCRYGIPQRIISDNGPQFISHIYQKLCKLWKVKAVKTSFYHPQNNLTERVNRNLKQMIRSFVEHDHQQWDQLLPQFALAIRTSKHSTTGFTPAKLFLGRDLVLPWDISCKIELAKKENQSIQDKVLKLELEMTNIYDMVKKTTEKMKSEQKRYYDRYAEERHFKEGDLVKVVTHPQSIASKFFTAKFVPPWKGPFVIKKKFNNLVYEIMDDTGKSCGKYNIVNLDKFYSKNQNDNYIVETIKAKNAMNDSEQDDNAEEHKYFTRSKNKQ